MIGTKISKIKRVLFNFSIYSNSWSNYRVYRRMSAPPIIICGCPRSGTTLLMSILDSHPEIHVIPFETEVLQYRPIHKRIFKRNDLNGLFTKVQIILYLFTGRIKKTAIRWCEKTPLNILNVMEIRDIFNGEVRFVNIIRDGRDVVSSYHDRLGFIVKPELWLKCIESAQAEEGKFDFFSIQYESLLGDPEAVLEELRSFLNLRSAFDLQNWFIRTRINRNRSMVNGKEMIFQLSDLTKNSIGKYKNSRSPRLNEFMNSEKCILKNEQLGYV